MALRKAELDFKREKQQEDRKLKELEMERLMEDRKLRPDALPNAECTQHNVLALNKTMHYRKTSTIKHPIYNMHPWFGFLS